MDTKVIEMIDENNLSSEEVIEALKQWLNKRDFDKALEETYNQKELFDDQ
jgi:TPP-dependent pyruvate/acetoin dehydrogenase alpha subunit